MKRIISCILSLAMLLNIVVSIDIIALATNIGTNLDESNVTCSYDLATNTLIISGSGKMKNWTISEVTSNTISRPSAYNRFGVSPASISNIIIENGVTSIGDYAFYNCTGLTSVTISDSVVNIGSSAFEKCTELTKSNYTGTIDQWCKINFNNKFSNPIYYSQNFYINDNLLTSTEIKTTNKITPYAFFNCNSLTNLIISENVKSIGNYAFQQCIGLKQLSIPCSLSLVNGGGVDDYNGIFYGCSNIEKITFTRGTGNWCDYSDYRNQDVNTIRHRYEYTPYYKNKNLKEIVIENGVNNIGNSAFVYCTGLTSVTIPDSVTSIGNSAFDNCSNLNEIAIPDSVKSIGDAAFSFSGIKSITIPANVTIINTQTFSGCSKLENVIIPDSVTKIDDAAFESCTGLKNIVIPYSVTNIGQGAFYRCNQLAIYIKNPKCSIIDANYSGAYSLKTLHCSLIRSCSNSTSESYAEEHNIMFETVHSYKSTVIPATCTSQGYIKDICEFCGVSSQHDFVPITSHSWDNGVVIIQPSCTKEGEMTYTCSYCGETRIESISKLKHNSVIDKKIEPTCTTTGLSEGSHCSVCGITLTEQKVLPMIDHLWDKGTVSLEPSCSKEGKLTYSCLSCGQTTDEVLPEIGHDLLETVIPNEPHKKIVTCSNRVKTLELDHSSYPESTHPYSNNENKTYSFFYPNANEYIVKFSDSTELENNYDFIYVYDSTGNQIGKYTGTQLKSKEIVIKSANFEIKLTSDSSQTKYGFSIDSIYAILQTEEKCNYYQEIITEHDYVVVEARKATCNDDGYNKYQCSICGDEYTEYIFSEGHTYIDEIVAATCTQDGYTIRTCSACGDAYVNNKTAALGHRFSEWIYNGDSQFVSSSNYKNGTQTRTCSECGEEETIEAPNTALLRRRGTALSLESSITLTTYITKDVVDYYDDVYAEFTRNDKKEIVRASDKIFKSGSTVYNVFDYTGISPQAIGDDIEVVFYGIKDGVKYWGNPYSISATSYIQTMLNTNTSSAKLKTMLVDLLYYGEACQVYQNYKTDKLMTSILTEEQKQLRSTGELELNNIRDASYKTCENRLVRLGSALKLSNAVEMAIPLNMTDVTLEELTIKVKIGTRDLEYTCADNPEKFKKEKDGYWYFYFDGVYANQMSDEVFITAYRGDEQVSYTLKYNVESYAATVTDPKLKKVTDAMMRYGNSAKAYSCK